MNKVNTKVDVRFNVATANWLKDDLKQKLIEKVTTSIFKLIKIHFY